MTDTSESFDGYSFGTYSSGVFTATGDRVGANPPVTDVYIVDGNNSDTNIPVNTVVTFNYTQGTAQTASGTYLGYYVDGDGVQHPFLSSGGNYYLAGEPGKASQTYAITSAPYTQGTVTCFTTGTLIRVLRNSAKTDVAVEHLAIGDLAVTASGAHRPIKWIGHRSVDCRSHRDKRAAWPIRVMAHAFAENKPSRDLFLSPGHSVCIDVVGELFIPVGSLVNGATIARIEVDTVTYWHVELEGGHDVLLAENLPAESYMDCGNRAWFAGAKGNVDPNRATGSPAEYCRPFFAEGAIVDVVRDRLAARAEKLCWTTTCDMDLHLVVDGYRIDGDFDGNLARFVFPTSAHEVHLVSETFVPTHFSRGDDRTLGVSINSFHVGDGLRRDRTVAVDDPVFDDGFHQVEGEPGAHRRWTNGRLRFPAVLWADCRTHVTLRVSHAAQAGLRWIAPLGASAREDANEASNVFPLRVA